MHEGLKPCQFRQVDNHGRILCGLIKGGDREVSVNLCRACPVPQINCQHLRASLNKNVPTPLTVRFATGRVEVWDNEPPAIEFKHAACAEKTMPIHSPRDCTGCPIRLPNVVPQNAIQVAHQARQNVPPVAAAEQLEASPTAPRPKHAIRAQPGIASAQARVSTPAPDAGAPTRAPGVMSEPELPLREPTVQPAPASTADLIARARATAARKAEQRSAAEREERERSTAAREQVTQPEAAPQARSKIILLQQWLADQLDKKQAKQAAPNQPDAEGVSDIVYSPVAAAYHEDAGYERCVGWTD